VRASRPPCTCTTSARRPEAFERAREGKTSARYDHRALVLILVLLVLLVWRRLELPPTAAFFPQVDKDRLGLPMKRRDEHLAVAQVLLVSFRIAREESKGKRGRERTCFEDAARRSSQAHRSGPYVVARRQQCRLPTPTGPR